MVIVITFHVTLTMTTLITFPSYISSYYKAKTNNNSTLILYLHNQAIIIVIP